MTIIIPMAGLSSRFTNAGYVLPKYMLYVKNRSLFNLAVSRSILILVGLFLSQEMSLIPGLLSKKSAS